MLLKIKKKFKFNIINKNQSIKRCLWQLNKSKYKCLIVCDNQRNKVIGTLSDGDIRRALISKKTLNTKIGSIVKKHFIYFDEKNYNLKKIKLKFSDPKLKVELIPILNKQKNLISIFAKDNLKNKLKKDNASKKNIKVIVMAGGKGTRLLPLTNVIPKPLIPINKKTMVENILDNFVKYGMNDFFISINYKSYLLKSFFKELGTKYKVSFLEEKKPLGTAGSLYLARKKKVFKNYFITNCDTILKTDLSKVYNNHLKSKKTITIIACKKSYNISYGVCNLDNKGRFKNLSEKPIYNNLVNTGMYIASSEILKLFNSERKIEMNKVITQLAKNNEVNVYKIKEKSWVDVGQWPEYKKFLKKIDN